MATTISPEYGPPQVVNARRTESLDAPHIMKLVQDSTNNLFGRVNVVNLMYVKHLFNTNFILINL